MSVDLERLRAVALDMRRQAYAPYSNYQVGAALLGGSGRVYGGCNVENASYGLTMCAERVALGSAVAGGEREFQALVLVTAARSPAAPCGACRQVLMEFSPAMTVVSTTLDGKKAVWKLSELLPSAFGFADLR